MHLHLQAHQDLKNLILGLCHLRYLRHLKVKEDKVVARVEEEQLTKSVKPIINLNAFIILAENIRVGIAVVIVTIADNTIHSSIHRFIDSSIHLKKYIKYLGILYLIIIIII